MVSDGLATFTPGISERRSGVSKFLHQDYLGSTKQITSSSQAVTDTRQYDAFGLLTGSSGSTPTPFAFAGGWGYQQDSTGLQLLGHRYYDPSTGRFLIRDPIKDGRNWYGYCENNPLKFVDPAGLVKVVIVMGDRSSGGLAAAEMELKIILMKLREMGYKDEDVQVLRDPSEDHLSKAISNPKVEGLVLVGHGSDDSTPMQMFDLGGRSDDDKQYLDSNDAEKFLKIRKGKPFKFTWIFACNSQQFADNWSAVSYSVAYFDGACGVLPIIFSKIQVMYGPFDSNLKRMKRKPAYQRRGGLRIGVAVED